MRLQFCGFFGETGSAHPLTSFSRPYTLAIIFHRSGKSFNLIVFNSAICYSCRKNPTLQTHALADRLAFSIHTAPLQRRSSRTAALAGASLYRVHCVEPAASGAVPSLCRTRPASAASDYEKASRHADRCTDFRHHHRRRHTSAPSAQSSASGAERHRYLHMTTAPRSR